MTDLRRLPTTTRTTLLYGERFVGDGAVLHPRAYMCFRKAIRAGVRQFRDRELAVIQKAVCCLDGVARDAAHLIEQHQLRLVIPLDHPGMRFCLRHDAILVDNHQAVKRNLASCEEFLREASKFLWLRTIRRQWR
jgi:hypothetical protein